MPLYITTNFLLIETTESWLKNWIILLVLFLYPASGFAAQHPMMICERAAQNAAHDFGVPSDVLRAISRTETGYRHDGQFGPWPWTVNMEGKGVWFENEEAAKAYVYKHFKRGARSFDVGCFQINYRWHHQEFASLDEMFEPQASANYAAKFLKSLYAETGSWEAAAGAYHSRTPALAKRYRSAFRAHLAKVRGLPLRRGEVQLVQQSHENNYPLLISSEGTKRAGSLFSATENNGAQNGLLPKAARGVLQ